MYRSTRNLETLSVLAATMIVGAIAVACVMLFAKPSRAQDGLANAVANSANASTTAQFATGANLTLSLPGVVNPDSSHGAYVSSYTSNPADKGSASGNANPNATSVKK